MAERTVGFYVVLDEFCALEAPLSCCKENLTAQDTVSHGAGNTLEAYTALDEPC